MEWFLRFHSSSGYHAGSVITSSEAGRRWRGFRRGSIQGLMYHIDRSKSQSVFFGEKERKCPRGLRDFSRSAEHRMTRQIPRTAFPTLLLCDSSILHPIVARSLQKGKPGAFGFA
jgi:hypothetical protein